MGDTTEGRTRRRGVALEQAIFAATLSELSASGYAGLTVEAVAERAGTGKAAIYRRWTSKKDLVLAAVSHALPGPPELAPDQPVRDRLVAALLVMVDALAGRSALPAFGELIELLREPDLGTAFRARVVEPRLHLVEQVLRDGAERGEVDRAADVELIARLGPALVVLAFLLHGEPPSERELARLVDGVVMPLATRPARRSGAG